VKKSDLVSSSFWLVFSSLGTLESYRLGLGDFRSPGPGFLPFVASLVLGVLSLLVLLQTIYRKEEEEELAKTPSDWGSWEKVIYTLAALLLYVFLLEKLGFLLCTLLLVAFLLLVVERQRSLVVMVTAFFATIFSYILFQVWLNIQLPSGVLGIYP
jgi:putative tricarboxylic transport membrane protein